MKYSMYFHYGSFNHGCEALVRSTARMFENQRLLLFSNRANEDKDMGIDEICDIKPSGGTIVRNSPTHVAMKILSLLDKNAYHKYQYKNLLSDIEGTYLSIGGDTYCYKNTYKSLNYINDKLNAAGANTVLWGCSIEPEMLTANNMVRNLKKYKLITARESITYNALLEAGIDANTQLCTDPAFILPTQPCDDLPVMKAACVGINTSPLLANYGDQSRVSMCFEALVEHIIRHTDRNILLVPHVVWDESNDILPLNKLYQKYSVGGRIAMLNRMNCMQLKYYISKCETFIGARTHSTIAAYSTCVPTVAVGYSVKSRGIAKDIFGTYDPYVLPVQNMSDADALLKRYVWLDEHKDEIRRSLSLKMPGYKDNVYKAYAHLLKLN